MRVLNLYAGIGGNRKLWTNVDVTAVEWNKKIAQIYQDFFPDDKVIITDAHQYLLDHFQEYDFIWSSPPCTTHAQLGRLRSFSNCQRTGNYKYKVKYPDMKLYEEVLLLNYYFKRKWVIENVIGYYKPLIPCFKRGRHYFWSNFLIAPFDLKGINIAKDNIKTWESFLNFDLSKYKNIDKRTTLRNCVLPELGLHILNESQKEDEPYLFKSLNK